MGDYGQKAEDVSEADEAIIERYRAKQGDLGDISPPLVEHVTKTKEEGYSEPEKEVIESALEKEHSNSKDEIMELPIGKLSDITKRIDETTDSWINVGEKRYKITICELDHEKALDVKIHTWVEAKGDKDLYHLKVRYALAEARVKGVNGFSTTKDPGLWNRLSDDVVDFITDSMYGPATIDTPEAEGLLKNLVKELMSQGVNFQNGSKESAEGQKRSGETPSSKDNQLPSR